MIERRSLSATPALTGDVLTGRAAVYGVQSHILGTFREVLTAGVFAESLSAGREIIATFAHDPAWHLGSLGAGTLVLTDGPEGLDVAVSLPDTTAGRDVRALHARGELRGMSFLFAPSEDEFDFSGPIAVRTVRKAELYEVSFLGLPAYPQTFVNRSYLDARRPASVPLSTLRLHLQLLEVS